MSGIAGIWNRDGQPVDTELLRQMSRLLAHRGPDDAGLWHEGAVGFVCRLARTTPEAQRETQPAGPRDGVTLVFDGRLDNRSELLRALPDEPGLSSDVPDSELLLAFYLARGEAFAAPLIGDFAVLCSMPVGSACSCCAIRSASNRSITPFSETASFSHPRSRRSWPTRRSKPAPTRIFWPSTCWDRVARMSGAGPSSPAYPACRPLICSAVIEGE